MEDLEAKVDSEEYDIVAVSETLFKEESNWRTVIRRLQGVSV